MPLTSLESSPELKIVLETGQAFAPGDTIGGYVLRQSPSVDTNTSISIRLCARTRVYIATGGMGRYEYISTFNLLDSSHHFRQLHQGPIHIPPNGSENEYGRWPFAITLPKNPNLESLTKDNEKEKIFLPFEEIASQELPASFSVIEKKSGRYTEGFVEYYLEASMRCTRGQKNAWISRKKHSQFQAILPLQIRSDLPSIPSTGFSTQHRSEPKHRLVSQRLVLGVDSRLGVGQHIQKMIKSSQVPGYSFSLQLDFASLLQIGNPNPIPLLLRANTIWADTSDDLRKTLPTILVKKFNLILLSNALCTCKWFKRRTAPSEGISVKSTSTLADYAWAPAPTAASYANGMPSKARSKTPLIVPQDDSTPLDLGIALGIRSPKSSTWTTNIYPTFTTCNIRTTHAIRWDITLSIAGETVRYREEQPVTMVGPAHPS